MRACYRSFFALILLLCAALPLATAAAGSSDPRWAELAASDWVADGEADAPRVVYIFSDPSCPFCSRTFAAARPWVDSGKLQLRQILVGLIAPDSAAKAAAILGAADRTAALRENEAGFAKGGIAPAPSVPAAIRKQLDAHAALLRSFGFHGTPGLVWLDAEGRLHTQGGLPREGALETIFGPR